MITQPNSRNWFKIGPHTYVSRSGDTVVLLDKDTALINDVRVRGSRIIRNRVQELVRK